MNYDEMIRETEEQVRRGRGAQIMLADPNVKELLEDWRNGLIEKLFSPGMDRIELDALYHDALAYARFALRLERTVEVGENAAVRLQEEQAKDKGGAEA